MPNAKPTRRSGRVLVVALRQIIQDSRSSPRIRLSACRLLAICEGILPLGKRREETSGKLTGESGASRPQRASNAGGSNLATLAQHVAG